MWHFNKLFELELDIHLIFVMFGYKQFCDV